MSLRNGLFPCLRSASSVLPQPRLLNILCTSGGLASEVAMKFEEAGYNNVAVVVGGIIEAEYEGVEVLKN